MQLSSFAFISVQDAADWLGLKSIDAVTTNKLTRLINTATAQMEKYIDGPILARQFTEQRDGNSSNVIVPSFYPVRSVLEVRIDYNRQFTDLTKLEDNTFVLRGSPSLWQTTGDGVESTPQNSTTTMYGINPQLQINGSDIILRDDNSTAILGRIFAGSVVQSILVTYTAGWGSTPDMVPADLSQAALMLVEYHYMLNTNRDQGIKSRTNTSGQSYTRDTQTASGMPNEVTAILDGYKDYSLGIAEVPQNNTFVL